MNKRLNILIHIICWVVLLHLLFDIVGLYYSFHELFIERNRVIDDAFLLIPLLIALFYTNSHFLVVRLLSKKKVLYYTIGLIVLYTVFLLLGYAIISLFIEAGFLFRINKRDFIDILIFAGLTTIGISTSVGLIKIVQENSLNKKRAEEEQKKAELNYLSSQVNPHFLFNTLNAIYYTATEENAPKTTEAILRLSEIMRYPIIEGMHLSNPISKEIDFIRDYIELQKIRLGTAFPVKFIVEQNAHDIELAPFLFIPLIENAFKYGVSRDNPKPIDIHLIVTNNKVQLFVKNHKTVSKGIISNEIGISNLKQRLNLVYNDKGSLKITDNEDVYTVELEIQL